MLVWFLNYFILFLQIFHARMASLVGLASICYFHVHVHENNLRIFRGFFELKAIDRIIDIKQQFFVREQHVALSFRFLQ